MYVQNSRVLTKTPNLISTIPSVPEELKEIITPYGNKLLIYNFAYFFSNPLILPFKIDFDAIIYGNISIGANTVNAPTFQIVTIDNEDKLSISGNGVVILWYRYGKNIPLFDSIINYAIQHKDYVLIDALLHSLSLPEVIKFILSHPCIQEEFAKGLDWQLSKIGFNEFLKYINGLPFNIRDLAYFLMIASYLFPCILNEYNIPVYGGKPTDVYTKYLEYLGYPFVSEVISLSEQVSDLEVITNALIGITTLHGSEIEDLSTQTTYLSEQLEITQSVVNELVNITSQQGSEISCLSEKCLQCSENLSEFELQTDNEINYLRIKEKLLQTAIQQLTQIVEEIIAQNSEQRFEFYFDTLTNPQNFIVIAQLLKEHYDNHVSVLTSHPNLYNWAYEVLVNLVNSNFTNILPASNNYPDYAQETQILQQYLNKSIQCFAKAFIQYLKANSKNVIGQEIAQNTLALFTLVVEYFTLYGCYQIRSNNTSEFLTGLQAYITQGLYYALAIKSSLYKNGIIPCSMVKVQGAIVQSACSSEWVTFCSSKVSQQFPCYSTQIADLYNSYQSFKTIANTWLSLAEQEEPSTDKDLFNADELYIGTLMEFAYALSKLGYPPSCPTQQNVQSANNVLGNLIGGLLGCVLNLLGDILGAVLGLLGDLLNLL